MPANIEIFTAGCPLCTQATELVRKATCPACDIVVYDLAAGCATGSCLDKARAYGVKSLPAIVVDGQLAACCDRGLDAMSIEVIVSTARSAP